MSWGALGLAGLLLVLNAFFVAAEFALIVSRRTYFEGLAAEGSRRAQWAVRSSQELSVMLAGAQLGVTLASIGLGFVAEPALAHLVEAAFTGVGLSGPAADVVAFAIGLGIVVFAHMVIGEMVPKNLAIAGPERMALLIAGPLRLYGALFGPVIRLLNRLANAVLRLLGVAPADELSSSATAEDLAAMIGESRDEGMLDAFEEDLLRGALHFGEEVAESVMVPRRDIVAASARTPVDELERLVVTTGRTRIPLFAEDLDHVVGFFHAKALLAVPAGAEGDPLAPRLVRPVLVVPASRPLQAVLAGMRQYRTHLAMVTVDGSTVGLVSLQDVLDRLVGQINDGGPVR